MSSVARGGPSLPSSPCSQRRSAWNESLPDRTYGITALLFGVVAFFGYIYLADVQADAQWGYRALLLGATLVLHFIAAALVADSRASGPSLAG